MDTVFVVIARNKENGQPLEGVFDSREAAEERKSWLCGNRHDHAWYVIHEELVSTLGVWSAW